MICLLRCSLESAGWPAAPLGVVVSCLFLASVRAASPGFSEQSVAAGLVFTHAVAPDTHGDAMHGGGTVGDFNADGWPDIYVIGGGLADDALFINNRDGTFSEQAAAWGLIDPHRGGGATAGDYNNDGWQDLYVTSQGSMSEVVSAGAHRLYRNNGDGSFTDVAAAAGVDTTANWADGYGPVFGDYDLDGDLDLWVPGWHFGYLPEVPRSRLFRNEGDGSFTDVTESANVGLSNRIPIGVFCGAFADMDGDRYPELLIAGDAGTSLYYINNRDGTFTPHEMFLPDRPVNGMGIAIADFDHNGLPDWYISASYPAFHDSGPPGNRLYMNSGGHNFIALPESAGVNDAGWAWGAAARDFDHDGFDDLVITNGWLTPDPVTGEIWTDEPTYLFRNNGDSSFTDVAQSYGLSHSGQGRGLTELDYDRDGDIDIVIYGFNEPLQLWRNDLSGADANWLEVRLDTRANKRLAPDGQGSRLDLTAGGQVRTQQIVGANSYLGRGELLAHFGLAGVERIALLQVTWNDGTQTTLRDLEANQLLTVVADAPALLDHQFQPRPVDAVIADPQRRPRQPCRLRKPGRSTETGCDTP